MARRRDSSSNVEKFMKPKLINCSTSSTDLDLDPEENEGLSIALATLTMPTNDGAGKQTSRSQKKKHHPVQHLLIDISQVITGLDREQLLKLKELISACLKEEEAEKGECTYKKPKVSFVSRTAETEDLRYESDEDTNSDIEKIHTERQKHRDQHPMKCKRQSETSMVKENEETMKMRQRSKSSESALKNTSIYRVNASTSYNQLLENGAYDVSHERYTLNGIKCGHVMKCPSSGDQPKK
ncbi:uncharacterized protein LOC131954433 [Physella acuta]|uniref:uncharacterized protein LOC131954433 n=1 Tax=Physella acuta TaxID=109671 RepID=UPI0027DCDE5A|nr:uncharacterized protein LOC131954433 [Physella acuta]